MATKKLKPVAPSCVLPVTPEERAVLDRLAREPRQGGPHGSLPKFIPAEPDGGVLVGETLHTHIPVEVMKQMEQRRIVRYMAGYYWITEDGKALLSHGSNTKVEVLA